MLTKRVSKKLFFSLLIVLMWLGFLAEGSRAVFADSAVLSSNKINTGTVDLLVSNSQAGSSTTFAESRPGFDLELSPGISEERYFILKNTATSTVPLGISAMVNSFDGPDSLRTNLNFEFTPVNSDGDSVGATKKANLDQIRTTPLQLGSVIERNTTQRFKMRVSIDPLFSTQAVNAVYDLTLIGTQQLGV